MKVTLAYPFEGHKPETTVDVDDETARLLIREGRARLPETTKQKD